MGSLSLVLFRDGRTPSADAVAILRDIVRSSAGHYSLTEIDVKDRPALAAQYNVGTTPTILLMRNGDIVDRIIGTPTASLVNDLLDTRTRNRAKAS
jgi:thioredoxin 1